MTPKANGDLPPEARAQVDDAVAELLACVQQGFTGSLTFEFDRGLPMVIRRMAVRRFARLGGRKPVS